METSGFSIGEAISGDQFGVTLLIHPEFATFCSHWCGNLQGHSPTTIRAPPPSFAAPQVAGDVSVGDEDGAFALDDWHRWRG